MDSLAYVIPRASSGTTILGGTYIENSNDRLEDKATTERILKRCSEICPEIVPGYSQDTNGMTNGNHTVNGDGDGDAEGWKRIEIERVNVGFRPFRTSGPRIEIDKELKLKSTEGREVSVLHCYGLGSAGYQTSWGIAQEVLDLVKKCIPLQS